MKDLEEIRGRCRIVDGHWLWAGALRPDGRPHVYAPDHTKGGMTSQPGPRAVWHCITEKPIPADWRAYGTCSEKTCVNPAHVKCGPCTELGAHIAASGVLKNKTVRILANRAIGRKQSRLTQSLIAEIQRSAETGRELSRRLQLSEQLVSKVRTGQARSHQPMGVFTGLGAR